MCCGRTRPISTAPRLGTPARGATLAYTGRTALTVTGPATGTTYRFDRPGALLPVDPRDAPALLKIAVLRRTG